jgi:predicted amidophosphoribosyltransferase
VNREVIHAMKYRHQRGTATMMGRIMAETAPRPKADFLVPVPLHKGSEREYNQAELIARGASELWGIPVISCLRWRLKVPNQAASSGHEDRVIPENAVEAGLLPKGTRTVIIDDVCTSGSTLLAADRALKGIGAEVDGAFTWSRGSNGADERRW